MPDYKLHYLKLRLFVPGYKTLPSFCYLNAVIIVGCKLYARDDERFSWTITCPRNNGQDIPLASNDEKNDSMNGIKRVTKFTTCVIWHII